MVVVLAAFAAPPERVVAAAIRRPDAADLYDVRVALWAELPGYGADACEALQRGEAVESDPIGRIASLPAEIEQRLDREGQARNAARLRDGDCRVAGRSRSIRRKDVPAWLADVDAFDIVPVACARGDTIGVAVVQRRGEKPAIADVLTPANAGGYRFLADLLNER